LNTTDVLLFKLDVHRWSWESHNRTPPVVTLFLPALEQTKSLYAGKRGESFVTRVATLAYSACTNESDRVVLDVGASEGYYSMIAAAHGCGVFAFDLIRGCARMFEAARVASALNINSTAFAANRIRYLLRPLGSGGRVPTEGDSGCGTALISHMTHAKNVSDEANNVRDEDSLSVSPLGGDELRALLAPYRSVAFCKIDVEGAELVALVALLPVLPLVQHLVVEVTPNLWLKYNHTSYTHGFGILAGLLDNDGFGAARTSTGCTFFRSKELFSHLRRDCRHDRPCGWGNRVFYREGQIDIWFARDKALFLRASPRITGFLGRGAGAPYMDDPHGKNLTCPDPNSMYSRPRHHYRNVAEAEAARVDKCTHVCGSHPGAFILHSKTA